MILKFKQKVMSVVCLSLLLSACVIDGGGGLKDKDKSSNSTTNNSSNSHNVKIESLYETKPDIKKCQTGTLKNAEKIKVLNQVNEVRALHGLKPVTYNYDDDIYTARSALISAANSQLTHYPTSDLHCWTAEGAKGSKTSNLHLDRSQNPSKLKTSASHVFAFLIDNNVKSLGHRRWILSPFLSQISYGRVDGNSIVNSKFPHATGVALKVINEQDALLDDSAPDFVAYPYHSYPKQWFKNDWYQSFAVVADKSDRWGNKHVDFSKAKITVTDINGKILPATAIEYDSDTYGLPNNLQWKVVDTQDNQKYQVKIEHVKVNGQDKTYQYWYNVQ